MVCLPFETSNLDIIRNRKFYGGVSRADATSRFNYRSWQPAVKVSQAEYPPLLFVIAEHKILVHSELINQPIRIWMGTLLFQVVKLRKEAFLQRRLPGTL
jgi:hypothetical protein